MKIIFFKHIVFTALFVMATIHLLTGICWSFGYIQGYVQDELNQPIDGAKIATSTGYNDISNPEGFFVMGHPADIVDVTASATGFKSMTMESVSVTDNQFTNLAFFLTPSDLILNSAYPTLGQLDEELEVTLTGEGFDDNTRVSLSPDVGNKKAIIGSLDTPGTAFDIVLVNTTVYVADRYSGLRIMDITNPENPSEIGFIETPGEAWGVAVSGSTAYIADGENGLQLVDVSSPETPELLGSEDTPHFAHDVAVSGTTVYVADRESGLQIIDASNQNLPSIVGHYETSGEALDLVVMGTLVYVADSYGGLQIIDVSNPAEPDLEGFIDPLGGYASGLAINESTAYVATSYTGIHVVDVSVPSSPEKVRSIETPGWAQDVVVSGTTLYVADGDAGLQIIDNSVPETPSIIGSVNTPGGGHALALSGTNIFMADGYDGLQVIDVSNPSSIFIGSAPVSAWATDVVVKNNYAYVMEAGALGPGVTTVEISDPFNPVVVDELEIHYCYGAQIVEDHIYTANYLNGLVILDISTPAAPQVAGMYPSPEHPRDVAVSGTTAGLAEGPTLRLIDISDPTIPEFITVVDPDPNDNFEVLGVAASGTTMCITSGSNAGMRVIDISDPSQPAVSETVDTGYAESVAISGDHAYVGGSAKMYIVDINPSHAETYLEVVGDVDTTYSVRDITLVGNYAYLANDQHGIQILDITDPTRPATIGTVATFSEAEGVAVSGNAAYVADYYSGLAILPIPREISPVSVDSENEISVTIPPTNVAGPYTLRVFTDSQSSELYGAVSFTDDLQILNSKAIVVAGGGPDAPGEIWTETKLCANKAYDVLVQQGFDHDSIYYLSMETGNPFVDKPSLDLFLNDAFTQWAQNATELFVFFVDHGEPDTLILYSDGTYVQKVTVHEIDTLLDNLQNETNGPVTFIYDACQSGTFVSAMRPPEGKHRIVITSASNEPAYFLNSGLESFSFQFWDKLLFNEGKVNLAFSAASAIMEGYQTALLDADGNGIPNEMTDYTAAQNLVIKRGSPVLLETQPSIGSTVAEDQMLNGSTTTIIRALGVSDADRVTAQIIPPDINPDTAGIPVTDLPSITLTDPDEDNVFEGTYDEFTIQGTYTIIVKAVASKDIYSYTTGATITQDIYSTPKYVSVTRLDGQQLIEADTYEEDNTFDTAGIVVINDVSRQAHNFHSDQDEDWVKFFGIDQEAYTIKTSNPGVFCDTVIELFGDDGTTLLEGPVNTGGEGKEEALDWTCPGDGIYYIRVTNNGTHFGENIKYELSVYQPVGPIAGFITGMLTDALSNSPIQGATLRADSIGSAISLSNGAFLMVIRAGSYNVTVTAPAYTPKSITGIVVNEGQISNQDIQLVASSDDSDGDGVPYTSDNCPQIANPSQIDSDNDTYGDACDDCPDDGQKTSPGICGCGVADTDTDGDGSADCQDTCDNSVDTDGDGVADCDDECPADPLKFETGACGCGVADTDGDSDGTADCSDNCPEDPDKTADGICGCGIADTDTDGDGTPDCSDNCPDDPDKTEPGNCGCGVAETDCSGENQPPVKPTLTMPDETLTAASLTPQLSSGTFSDPGSDTHLKTQWQIAEGDTFSILVLDLESTDHLTSLALPDLLLEGLTVYFCRARFFDSAGNASAWSNTLAFTTMASPVDADADGVPDTQAVDDTVDLDGDQVPDNSQNDMLCVQTSDGGIQIAVQDTAQATVESLSALDPATIAVTTNRPGELPMGLISFKLTVTQGAKVQVPVLLSTPAPEGAMWYKYDSVNGWQDYTANVSFSDNRMTVTLTLTDGGDGDADFTENGIIIDPSGLAIAAESGQPGQDGSSSGGGGGGGGCFIESGRPQSLLLIGGILLSSCLLAAISVFNLSQSARGRRE